MRLDLTMHIGSRIKSIRLERGLTLPQLSVKAGVSIGLLSQLENADDASANPNLQTLRKIANALDVTVADLLDKPVAKSRAIVPERLDPGLTEFLESARKRGYGDKPSGVAGLLCDAGEGRRSQDGGGLGVPLQDHQDELRHEEVKWLIAGLWKPSMTELAGVG